MRLVRWFIGLVLVLGLLAGGGYLAGRAWLVDYMASAGPAPLDTNFVVQRGAGLATIVDDLAEAGIVDEPMLFRLGTRLDERRRVLQAGEYLIPARSSPNDVLRQLEEGKVLLRRVTVAEGLTSAEVVELLRAEPLLTGEITTIPDEGTLLPETYSFSRDEPRTAVLARMRDAMSETMAELWPARHPDVPLANAREALILASIIEKETALPSEYPLVASVFVNRLRKGMPLQTDPTIIYALTDGKGALGRSLTRNDLQVDDPYNTYRNKGLPPGPIANPGRGAIAAALAPGESDYIYFVADGTGGHAFAVTLQEHNRNVEKWRRVRDKAVEPAG